MTVSEALLRAAALVEQARTTVKPSEVKVACSACGSIPGKERREFKLDEMCKGLVTRLNELALSEFGQRQITKPKAVPGRGQ